MITLWFTFGQAHRHEFGGKVFDKDCVLEIIATNEVEAREMMFDCFGNKWSMQYSELPDMSYFPRGVVTL
jgi:hypothetical protein